MSTAQTSLERERYLKHCCMHKFEVNLDLSPGSGLTSKVKAFSHEVKDCTSSGQETSECEPHTTQMVLEAYVNGQILDSLTD